MTQRRPTIQDVASLAAVSQATVSRVLRGQTKHIREETRDRVLQVVSELNYRPSMAAAALRTNRTYTITLVIPDITNPIWPAVARGVQRAARREGYAVVLANTDWDSTVELEYVAMAQRAGMDGILINPVHVTNTELLASGVPAVILGSHSQFPDFDVFGVDTEKGSGQAIRHLYDLGHRRIALIAPPLHFNSGRKRYRGYRRAIAECGLAEDPRYVVQAPYSFAGGADGCARLLALPEPPTAIFASNDQQAIGALRHAIAAGLTVPDDLSIIGLDDIDAAAVTSPPLTTLARPQAEYGAAALEFLIERIEGRGPAVPRRRLFPCELVVRGSTAPPRALHRSLTPAQET